MMELELAALGRSVLVLGGTRSGKSKIAESLIEGTGGGIYLATAELLDDEMQDRVSAHKARRGNNWQTVEEPLAIAAVIEDLTSTGNEAPLLIDCLTLWLSNLIHHKLNIIIETQKLTEAIDAAPYTTILVSNEVGQGIVPDNALARQFRDAAGLLHQSIAAHADSVIFVVAGIPQRIK